MKVLKNPFWLVCVILFTLHQVAQKSLGWNFWWADNYLDPLLGIPILLGLVLAERRFFIKKFLANRNASPTKNSTNTRHNKLYTFSIFEISVVVVALSIIFEEGFPRWVEGFTKDYFDYLAYFVGALLFYFFINKNGK